MVEEEKSAFLYQRKAEHVDRDSADDKFDVIVPKRNLILLIIIFIGLFLAQFYYFTGLYFKIMYPEYYDPEAGFYWWVPFVFLIVSIVPILAWGQVGSRFATKSIVKYLRRTVSKKRPNPGEILLGYPIRTSDIYYLEAYPMDLNLGSDFRHVKVFLKRVIEVLFLSVGMSVVIAQVVSPFIYAKVVAWDPDLYFNIQEMMMDMTIYLGPFTLIILLFIMPVFWIAEDTQAYRIDEYQDSVRIGYYLRTGLISKILGFFGLVLVFNLAQQYASAIILGTETVDYSSLMKDPIVTFNVFFTTFLWFFLIIAMCAASPFLVSLAYLSFFHARWVNNVRIRASEFIPLGTLEIEKPNQSKLKYLSHPEMIDDVGGFFQTLVGRIILITLVIVASVVCIYLAFILGFEPALF